MAIQAEMSLAIKDFVVFDESLFNVHTFNSRSDNSSFAQADFCLYIHVLNNNNSNNIFNCT